MKKYNTITVEKKVEAQENAQAAEMAGKEDDEMNRDEKVLYFEGAGWEKADISKATVGNCRIRTAFSLDDGRRVYLELIGNEFHGDKYLKERSKIHNWKYTGFVDICHFITDDKENDDCNLHRFPRELLPASFEYSFNGILSLVNSLGASFDRIEVINTLGGYYVFTDVCSGTAAYNYGDEFRPDDELIEHRKQIYNYIEDHEKQRGEKFPCFSLWVDAKEPAALHFRNFRENGFIYGINDCIIYAGVPADVSKLPTLERFNAVEGAFYSFCNKPFSVEKVYSISEEYAAENELYMLDRAKLSTGEDIALSGSRVRS